jgi:hypothetical protein
MKKQSIFFDVHLHAFNLSHAGLLAFINRFFLNNALTFEDLLDGRIRKILFKLIFKPNPLKSRFRNFLAIAFKVLIFLILFILISWVFFALIILILSGIFKFNFLDLSTWQHRAVFFIALIDIVLIVGGGFIYWFSKRKKTRTSVRRTINILSIFENDLARQFQYLELDYLRLSPDKQIGPFIENQPGKINFTAFSKKLKELWENGEKKIKINDTLFDKIIINPLMMDFGYKGFDGLGKNKVHYYLAPRKQIKDQANDLFTGIKQYYENSPVKLFEIYPFMAINTANLEMENEENRLYSRSLQSILNKYFSEFEGNSGNKRYPYLVKKMHAFLKSDNYTDSKNFYYAGIKVYPPLGFNPWPNMSEKTELEKVKYLYSFCQKNKIPITTHCSDGGFMIIEQKKAWHNTKPHTWENVLKEYPDLKLNFAHAGVQAHSKTRDWLEKILHLVSTYENVYFDISYNGVKPEYYKSIDEFISTAIAKYKLDEEKIGSRILFGSDFMVNLFDIDSYLAYIKTFSEIQIPQNIIDKNKICTTNPHNFLFG